MPGFSRASTEVKMLTAILDTVSAQSVSQRESGWKGRANLREAISWGTLSPMTDVPEGMCLELASRLGAAPVRRFRTRRRRRAVWESSGRVRRGALQGGRSISAPGWLHLTRSQPELCIR
jgi:hypothetical protein